MNDSQKLVDLVIKEAGKLKIFATEKELSHLSFEKLNPDNQKTCIYGQITGDCFSNRASELILKCAERIYEKSIYYPELNGAPKKDILEFRFHSLYKCWSPIEVFICKLENRNSGNNKKLIQFLKSEVDTLKFAEI